MKDIITWSIFTRWIFKRTLSIYVGYSKPHCILTAQQVEKLHRLNELRSKINSLASVIEGGSGAQFRAELERLYKYQQLKEDLVQAEYMNSEASLKQLPDYHMRVKVRNP